MKTARTIRKTSGSVNKYPAIPRLLSGFLLILLAVACASDREANVATTVGEPAGGAVPTLDEAGRVADALVANSEGGGAAFTAQVEFGVATFNLDGVVEWGDNRMSATLRSTVDGVPEAPIDLWLGGSQVIEQSAELTELFNDGEQRYLVVPFDPKNSRLHVVLGVIMALQSPVRDTPALLIEEGLVRVGPVEIDGAEATEYRLRNMSVAISDDSYRIVRANIDLASTDSTATVLFPGDRNDVSIRSAPKREHVLTEEEAVEATSALTVG